MSVRRELQENMKNDRSGKRIVRTAQVAWVAVAPLSAVMAQAPTFEAVATLSSEVVPIERSFDIAQGGEYRLTAIDLGARQTVPEPAPLEHLQVIVTRGATVVASVDDEQDPQSATDSVTFEATPGSYVARIVGKPGEATGSGQISVAIEHVASGNAVLSLADTLSPPETFAEGVRSYQTEIEVTTQGDYQLSLDDLEFPRALRTAGVLVFQAGASAPAACLSLPEVPDVCPATTTVALAPGRYQVVAGGAVAAGSDAGAFSVRVSAVGGGAVLHSRVVEIGRVRRVSPDAFQLDAGQHSLSLKDLGFPLVLSEASVIVTRAGQVVAMATAAIPDTSFAVASNNSEHDVLAYALPDTTEGAGSFTVEVRPGTAAPVLSAIEAVGNAAGSTVAYTFRGDVPTAGAYRARLADFQFPASLSSARLAVVQNDALIAQTPAANPGPTHTLELPNLAAAAVTAIVVVRPAAVGGTVQQSGGTFGLELTSASDDQSVIDATQGIGALISVRKVGIAAAGRYDLTLTDLGAPAPFQDLMAVVSRGAQKLGTVVVGGSPDGGTATLMDVEMTAGSHSLTIIAQPGAELGAATYAVGLASSPAAPTVTIDASPREVTNGAVTRLTWSSENATACTASSNPTGLWSGNKAGAGNENSPAITTTTTFTLRCTGAGGRAAERSVSVTVAAPSAGGEGGGGGGSFGWWAVLGLAACHVLGRAATRSRKASALSAR